jgi:hypothetical protein
MCCDGSTDCRTITSSLSTIRGSVCLVWLLFVLSMVLTIVVFSVGRAGYHTSYSNYSVVNLSAMFECPFHINLSALAETLDDKCKYNAERYCFKRCCLFIVLLFLNLYLDIPD